jgi:hypothetical protein
MANNRPLIIVALILLGFAIIVILPIYRSNAIYDIVRIVLGVLIFIGFGILMVLSK